MVDHNRQKSKDLMSPLIEDAGVLVFVLDEGGRIVSVNGKLEEVSGYKLEEIKGQSLWEALLAEDEAAMFAHYFQSISPDEYPINHENYIKSKNGLQVPVLWSQSRVNLDGQDYLVGYGIDYSEKKQEELELLDQNEKIQKIIESSPQALILTDDQARVIKWNFAAEEIFGWKEKEVVGEQNPVIPMANDRRGEILFEAVMQGRMVTGYETSGWKKDGELVELNLSMAPLTDYEGKVKEIVIMALDINERKKNERALRESEEKYRSLVENLNEIVYILNERGEIEYVTPNIETISGYSQDEIIRKSFTDFIYPEDQYKRMENFKEVLMGEASRSEYRFITKKGNVIWIKTAAQPIFREGLVVGAQGVLTNITDLKEAQERLNRQVEEQDILLDNIEVQVWYLKDIENYGAVNNAHANFFGIKKENLEHKSLREIVSTEEEAEDCIEGNRQVFEEKVPVRSEEWLINGDGEHRLLSISKTPKLDEEGEVEYVVCSAADITERKKAEEALAKSEKELARAYKQLTEEFQKAEEIHNRILPDKIPQPDEVSLAVHIQPAERIGADSYHVTIKDNKLYVYLADVMGHGLDGAMISVFIKEAIDSYISLKPEDISPRNILTHLANQYYRENYPDNQLICIFMGVLDLETLDFSYCGAGFQFPPLVKRGDGEKDKLDVKGLFISNMVPYEVLQFFEYNVKLEEGTTVFISTDGLMEQKKGEEWFFDYYEDVFYKYSHLPPEVIVEAMNREFCLFNKHSLVGDDDISYLVLKVPVENKRKYQFVIPSKLDELDSLYDEITDSIGDTSKMNDLITCLHELVVNAIEHGNEFDPEKKVTIEIIKSDVDNYIVAKVEDEGEGFNWCDKIKKPVNMDGYAERGRGISMTCLLSGDLFYNYKGNRATLLIQQV